MSFYADYIRERTHDYIVESKNGFATYRYLNDGKSVYIIDIFVSENSREKGCARFLADLIVEEAKKRGCTELLGTVQPAAKNSTTSLKVLLGYGMTLHGASHDAVIFRKDI